MKTRNLLLPALTLLLALLSGCDTYQQALLTEKATATQKQMIEQKLAASRADATAQSSDYMTTQYVTLQPTLRRRSDEHPELKCRGGDFAIATDEPVSLAELAQTITRECGIPVRITQDAMQYLARVGSGEVTTAASSATTVPSLPGAKPLVGPAGIGGAVDNKPVGVFGSGPLIDVNFKGKVDDLLSMVMAREGLSYRTYKTENGTPAVDIFAIQTKTFSVHMLPATVTMNSVFDSGTTQTTGATSSTAGGGGGASSSGQGSGQSNTLQHVASELKGSIWADIDTTVKSMGNAHAEPMSASVTVTDTADVIERVKEYVDAKNKVLDKFAVFQVDVYSVTMARTNSLGANWNLVWQDLAGKGITLANTFAAPEGAIAAGFSVLTSSTSPLAGTSAMLDALNELGATKLTRSTPVPAMNLTLGATQTGQQDGYLQSSGSTQSANVGSTSNLQGGQIDTGFNISLLPDVLEDNSMLLKFQINLSTNAGIRTVTSQGAKLELPSIGLPLNATNTVPLEPGQSLLLTGQDYDDENSTRSGVGAIWNWFFGGGINQTKSHTLMVVIITPTLKVKDHDGIQ